MKELKIKNCGLNVCSFKNSLPNKNIVEIVSENESLTTLVGLLPSSVIELLNGNENYTLLAPSNQAFEQISQLTPFISEKELLDILTYHVIPGFVKSSDLCNCMVVKTLLTHGCCNQILLVNLNDCDCGVKFIGANSEASVINSNIEASNGVIHIIDSVLIPNPLPKPFRNIFQLLSSSLNNKPLSKLFSLLPNSLIELLSSSNNYTLLAPSDDAFEAIKETVESLEPEQLLIILKNHIIPGKFVSSDLNNGMIINTLLTSEALAGENLTLTVNISDENVKFIANNSEPFNSAASVIDADLQAKNGVIHIIDDVLIP